MADYFFQSSNDFKYQGFFELAHYEYAQISRKLNGDLPSMVGCITIFRELSISGFSMSLVMKFEKIHCLNLDEMKNIST